MKVKNVVKLISTSLIASAFLASCGSDAVVTTIKKVQGKAIDGYLKESTVCLDLNKDGACQSTLEPTSTTDKNGGFTLNITNAHQAHENYDEAMIVVYGGEDTDTGKAYAGKLKAPNKGTSTINVTPISTQVAAGVEKTLESQSQELSQAQILQYITNTEEKVKQAFSLPAGIDVNADPIALAKTLKTNDAKSFLATNIALHKAIDTMVEVAKTESANSGKKDADISEDMFEALAFGLDDMASYESGIDTLIEKTASNTQAKAKLGNKLVGSYKVASQVATKTQEVFNTSEIDFNAVDIEKEIIQAVIIADDFKDQMADKINDVNFDFNVTDEDFSTGDLSLDVNMSLDFEKERLENMFSDYNLTDSQLEDMKQKVDTTSDKDDMLNILEDDSDFDNIFGSGDSNNNTDSSSDDNSDTSNDNDNATDDNNGSNDNNNTSDDNTDNNDSNTDDNSGTGNDNILPFGDDSDNNQQTDENNDTSDDNDSNDNNNTEDNNTQDQGNGNSDDNILPF
jgi:hypothetical protein